MATKIYLGAPPAHIVNWIKSNNGPKLDEPLTFTSSGDTEIWFESRSSVDPLNLEYSDDNGINWISLDGSSGQISQMNKIELSDGQKFMIRANDKGNEYINKEEYLDADGQPARCVSFGIAGYGRVSISGNIQTLLSKDGTRSDVPDCCYSGLFDGAMCISSARSLLMPATTLGNMCYSYMFRYSACITESPILVNPINYDYNPYEYMFYGCTNLKNIEVDFNTWGSEEVYLNPWTVNWVDGVSSSGKFICPEGLPETRGSSYIPEGWEIIRKIPK